MKIDDETYIECYKLPLVSKNNTDSFSIYNFSKRLIDSYKSITEYILFNFYEIERLAPYKIGQLKLDDYNRRRKIVAIWTYNNHQIALTRNDEIGPNFDVLYRNTEKSIFSLICDDTTRIDALSAIKLYAIYDLIFPVEWNVPYTSILHYIEEGENPRNITYMLIEGLSYTDI